MSEYTLLQQSSAERRALIAALTPRIVSIARGPRDVMSGILWRGGYLVTAAERLVGAHRVAVGGLDAATDASVEAQVLASDAGTDVAVIRLPADAPAAADSIPTREGVDLGESVLVVGHDHHGPLVSWGVVAAAGPAWHSRRGAQIPQRIEIAARVDGRFEGALVADTAGRVAAMLVAGPRGRALGIPAITIDEVVRTVEKSGGLPHPWLGVRLQMLLLDAEALAPLGRTSPRIPVIAGVEAGSPAAAAGLAPGDLLAAIEGQELDTIGTLWRALRGARPGQTLTLAVLRGGQRSTRSITVGERA